MPDLMISIVVALCVGALILVIFAVVNVRKREKVQALAEYCKNKAYSFKQTKAALSEEISVQSETFLLVSTMIGHRQEEATGSSAWEKKTVWKTRAKNSEWPSFILGSIPAAGDWDKLPDWMKLAALEKLMSENGIVLESEKAQTVKIDGKASYLLFEEHTGESREIIQKLLPLLNEWPAQFRLLIQSEPAETLIRVTDCYIQDADLLEKIIRLGTVASALPLTEHDQGGQTEH